MRLTATSKGKMNASGQGYDIFRAKIGSETRPSIKVDAISLAGTISSDELDIKICGTPVFGSATHLSANADVFSYI
ncbi:hypothetical protein ACO0K7_18155 [Undibacterium sp. Ji67W]|uniref:hypothetical protein n=1 Tax=Undibacterium sp. Ji67W TaxID=3413042 RepID=UPI003BEFE0F5